VAAAVAVQTKEREHRRAGICRKQARREKRGTGTGLVKLDGPCTWQIILYYLQEEIQPHKLVLEILQPKHPWFNE